ncbi:hypothetical protein WJX73_005947 [Symbiochloris irregularis]|uniref:AAA+ ATPase domain-containing protein n=1 Tax=Symbiochloris irregularis TaxID=706552 RepID=A0AAW1PPE3_9CHLO
MRQERDIFGQWDGVFGTSAIIAVVLAGKQFLPQEWVRAFRRLCFRLTNFLNPFMFYTIPEFPDQQSTVSELYDRARLYLSNKSTDSAHRVTVSQTKNTTSPIFRLGDGEACGDVYQGVSFTWTHFTNQRTNPVLSYDSSDNDERRSFQLRVLRRYRSLTEQYLQHIRLTAEAQEKRNRQLLVYTNTGGDFSMGRKARRLWDSQHFTHPATFDTIALSSKVKHAIISKLNTFAGDAAHYRKTGRPHKFGAFLFGPPGTGKTSVIAAIANYMQYSIYDLDLTGVNRNLDLRALLTQISDRAVVVIEDIDTVELPSRLTKDDSNAASEAAAAQASGGRMGKFGRMGGMDDQKSKLTLGGLLNFADGIRSSCGSERIFIFTTNHPERLDPALVRPGRMDLHLQLGYCDFEMFAALCQRYLGLSQHPMLDEIAKVLDPGCKITPADVTAVLDANRDDAEPALQEVLRRCKAAVSLSSAPHKVPSDDVPAPATVFA